MVLYFTSSVVSPPYSIFMGNDKFENEELIRWGWPEDVWFHVDKESSAHVYLRLRPNETLDDIPSSVIDDCAQLVKANSIKGNKLNNLDVIYTLWSNLKKTADMEVGQVGFFDQKAVRTVRVERRVNDVVNRLNKTKVVKNNVDLRGEREGRDRNERNTQKEVQRDLKAKEKDEAKRKEEASKLRSYDNVMKSENMTTNETGYDSDDFM
ncbi:PREDICTED: coiled-coil domain-containing protein 25-like [Rhagoletis zephyria]|uniref:coiled-coil domain-containing protein 25-like n=1 Tax=Rhagoletis zephyria TaxID=28612 RepID=UPI00081160CE|nr:PREDICTED: coiled-coil domain-containing protein 25-like [Rhagoletis zephyria]KAH9400511.1 Coiled-coil domain-containing protein 25 [Tyrophagus putrescentiae]